MKLKFSSLLLFIIGISFVYSVCFADNIQSLPEITKDDRILILAPHPDDEAIGTAGVIQKALKAGAETKIACFTNGDHYEFTFLIHEKLIPLRSKLYANLGKIRKEETINAMKFLGVQEKDIIFLGYPDFGTMAILTGFWGKTKPYTTFLTRISKVPYPECQSPDAAYTGESILKDLEKVISDFRPTKIFVSHPLDRNKDHQSLYLFLQIALWNLEGKVTKPQVFPYPVHISDWPKPRGYHPTLRLNPLHALSKSEIVWYKEELTPEETEAKHRAISFYKSQNKYFPSYLVSFARENELFGDYPIIELKEAPAEGSLWQGAEEPSNKENYILYAKKDGNLYIKLNIKRKTNVSINLLGYNKNTDFSSMPKIQLQTGLFGISIKDKKKTVSIKDAGIIYQHETEIIKIPLSVLGNPDYILCRVIAKKSFLPLSYTAWRIIAI